MMQVIPIKQTRAQLADLVGQVAASGRSFVITRFGKPSAMLVPVDMPVSSQQEKREIPGFGIWAKRSDILSASSWVVKQRRSWKRRSVL